MLQRDRSLLRTLSASQALLFSCALLAAGHHQATATHGYCTEHGELIHDSSAGHEHHVDLDHGALGQRHDARGAHDCPMLQLLSEQSLARASYLGPAASADGEGSSSQLAESKGAIPLLHLSPSHSPPRAV